MSVTVTICLNEEERQFFEEHTKRYQRDLSVTIKQLALEKMLDEYDMSIAERFEKGIVDGAVTVRPYSELRKETEN